MSQSDRLFWLTVPNQLPECRAWIEVNLDALADNVRSIGRSLTPGTQLLAVIKANAYGHGAVAVAQTALAAGATWLGVATVLEGIELREAGIQAPILLLGAANAQEEIEAIAHWHIQPTLCNLDQAQRFSQVLQHLHARGGSDRFMPPLGVHVKLDTGMTRLGCPWQEVLAFVEGVKALPLLKIVSLYSHLATADEPDTVTLWHQYDRFEQARQQLQTHQGVLPTCHLANSAATLVSPQFHYDLVRVGLALYGIYPAPHLQTASDLNLRPVLSLKARITQVKDIAAGTGVSYGHRFVAPRDMRIAVVAISYADGVSRLLSNQLQVCVSDRWVPQLGTITMDQFMIDVSTVPQVQPGAIVTLLGQTPQGRLGVETWAEQMGTIPWEVLCGFQPRLPRRLVRDGVNDLGTGRSLGSV